MRLITDWMVHSWELLQVRGWWFAVGLILCVIVFFLPLKSEKTQKSRIPFWSVILGALLPVCNFAAIAPAAALHSRGLRTGAVLGFLSAAVLLNPSGMLSAWAYMGPELTTAWIISAAAVSLMAGIAGIRFLTPAEQTASGPSFFSASVPQIAFWLVLGTLAQGLLQALAPETLWQTLLLDPAGASFGDAAAAAVTRHVCIPDDTALAASLAATGFPPGWVVLLLTAGICTNLPELFVLYGTAGKKTAAVYAAVTVIFSMAAAILTQLLIGPGFVPQYNLADAEPLIQMASLLTIRTWMPAKIPCALGLLLLAGWGLWQRGRK